MTLRRKDHVYQKNSNISYCTRKSNDSKVEDRSTYPQPLPPLFEKKKKPKPNKDHTQTVGRHHMLSKRGLGVKFLCLLNIHLQTEISVPGGGT